MSCVNLNLSATRLVFESKSRFISSGELIFLYDFYTSEKTILSAEIRPLQSWILGHNFYLLQFLNYCMQKIEIWFWMKGISCDLRILNTRLKYERLVFSIISTLFVQVRVLEVILNMSVLNSLITKRCYGRHHLLSVSSVEYFKIYSRMHTFLCHWQKKTASEAFKKFYLLASFLEKWNFTLF